MAESHGFIRILPDSTGKRLPQSVMMEVLYGNGTTPIKVGDVIVGATSGLSGTVIESIGTVTSGELHIRMNLPIVNNPAFVFAEQLQVNGITVALAANTGYAYYFQQNVIAGGDGLTNLMEVDNGGSAFVRFAEGSPQFDAFGKMQVSQQQIVAEYLHTYKIDTDKVSLNLIGSGTATHIPDSAGILLSVGTDAGAIAEVVSHQYHPYRLGQSRLIEFTLAAGDTGKTGLKRIWGYGDDSDGVYFMQYNGILYVRIKSTATGVQTDFTIPSTEWNVDRLDGTHGKFNKSGKTIDLTKDNIFWIDMQWLGAGTVRFGVVIDGLRIICHEWHHSNFIAAPYMRTGSLPIYFELKNETTTDSSSEMRIWCTVVKNEGDFGTPSKDFSYIPPTKTINQTTHIPICSFRSKELLNGLINRKSSYIAEICALSLSAPVIIEVWKNPVLTGASLWDQDNTDGALEFNTDATDVNITNARRLFSSMVDQTGIQKMKLGDIFNPRDEGIRRHFVQTNYDLYTITARQVSGIANTDVVLTLNWNDV